MTITVERLDGIYSMPARKEFVVARLLVPVVAWHFIACRGRLVAQCHWILHFLHVHILSLKLAF